MAYENQCGSCLEFKDKRDCKSCYDDSYYEKGYCDYYKSFYYPDDSCRDHYKNRKTYVPSTCYITTIVCGILGNEDACGVLNMMREFRNNVMQHDPKYKEMLYEYDTVGPIIAKNLVKDFGNDSENEIIIGLYNFYIQPTARLVKERKYDEAISRYQEMTKSLEEYYNITVDTLVPEEYDYTNGGHGIVKMKKLGTYPDYS